MYRIIDHCYQLLEAFLKLSMQYFQFAMTSFARAGSIKFGDVSDLNGSL